MDLKSAYDYDVVIVGAGPAGSSLAIRLAQNGLKILLIEQKRFPREKLCGEFISPECLAHLAELGVLNQMFDAGGVALDRTVFYAPSGKSVAVPSEWFKAGTSALGLSRAEMDERLIIRARVAGAEVMEETYAAGLLIAKGKVCGVRIKNDGGGECSVNAKLTIDAAGRARILSRQIDKENNRGKQKRAKFVAFKTHLEGAAIPPGDCEIYSYRGGYGGCSLVEKGRHNLCFIVSSTLAKEHGGDAETLLRKIVFANKRAKRSLCNARIMEDWLAVPIERYGRSELAPADGLMAVGDAAAFIDPFTGSGILLALESSKIAADAISGEFSKPTVKQSFAALADEYKSCYRSVFDRRLNLSAALRYSAFTPFLAEIIIRFLALNETLTRRLAESTRR